MGSHCGPGEMNKLASKLLKELGLKDVVKFWVYIRSIKIK